MIQFILVNLFLISIMVVSKFVFGFTDNVRMELILAIILGLLVIFKFTGNKGILIHGTLLIIIFTIWRSLEVSGGIFSYNLRWLVVPIIFAFLFLTVRSGLFYIIISTIICFTQYYAVSDLDLVDKYGFDAKDYFMDNVFLMTGITFSLALFYYGEIKFRNEINTKNIQLESNKKSLVSTTNELEVITGHLRDSNENLKQYANMTAHDLTQPVRTIKSFAELAKLKFESGKSKEQVLSHLDFVINSADGLNEKIQELLSIANSYDKNTPKLIRVELDAILKTVLSELTILIQESNAKINIGILPSVSGSKVKLENIFQNLISNGIKYCPENQTPELWIDALDKVDHILVSVRDNGIGIDEEFIPKVFQTYLQKDASSQGVGLGLYTCKRHVEFHGGEIWVESTPGNGSTFYFTIPK